MKKLLLLSLLLLLLKKIDKMCEHLALIKKHFPVPKRYLRDGQKTGPEGYFGRFHMMSRPSYW